jgi:hypothetical protein
MESTKEGLGASCNVQVAVRCRPLNQDERKGKSIIYHIKQYHYNN